MDSRNLSMGQITQAKALWTKEVRKRAKNAVLASQVAARLSQELKELNETPFSTITAGPKGDDIMHWDAYIMGPENTPYFGGLFTLRLSFPTTYPRDPPHVKFMTSVYHPGVELRTGIADPSLFGLTVATGKGMKENTIRSVLASAIAFFTQSVYSNLHASSVRNVKAQEQMHQDARGYHETALRWTYQYAQ
jgi:ubiquitin-protein ligase